MKAVAALVFLLTCFGMSHGMTCTWGEANLLERLTENCPKPFGNADDEYCCIDPNDPKKFVCCDFITFAASYIIIAIVVLVVLSILFSVLCCVCCPCCWIYKRRHGSHGGRINLIRTEYIQANCAPPYQPINPQAWPAGSGSSASYSYSQSASYLQPQPPYNPNYK